MMRNGISFRVEYRAIEANHEWRYWSEFPYLPMAESVACRLAAECFTAGVRVRMVKGSES